MTASWTVRRLVVMQAVNNGLEVRRTVPNTTLSSWIGAVTGGRKGASGSVTIYAICASGVVLAP